jgi:hypothetical protein
MFPKRVIHRESVDTCPGNLREGVIISEHQIDVVLKDSGRLPEPTPVPTGLLTH